MSNLYKNAKGHATTAETVLYTVPANTTAVIHSIFVSNITKSTTNLVGNITLKAKAVDTSTYHICGESTEVKPGKALEYGSPINLTAGEQFLIKANINDILDVFLSIMEYN